METADITGDNDDAEEEENEEAVNEATITVGPKKRAVRVIRKTPNPFCFGYF